jgi:hypothetical protein
MPSSWLTTVLGADGELVQLGAGQAPPLGDHLGAEALVRELALEEALQRGTERKLAAGERRAHRDPAHRLDAARDGHVVLAGDQAGGGEVHRLLGRAALTVHGHAGDAQRPARGDHRGAGDVEGLLADLAHAAPDDVVDLRGVNAGLLRQGLQHVGRQVHRVDARQRASRLSLADRRPDCPYDNRVTCHGFLLDVASVVARRISILSLIA